MMTATVGRGFTVFILATLSMSVFGTLISAPVEILKYLNLDPDFEDPINHYDKDHPINLTVIERNYTRMKVSWDMPKDRNDTDLVNFAVYYHKRNERKTSVHSSIAIEPDTFEALIKGLSPGTIYSFYVLANYSTGHKPVSQTYSLLLAGYGDDNACNCNSFGTDTSVSGCDPQTGQCPCLEGVTGRTCNTCKKYYYRHNTQGCRPCSAECKSARSDGTCRADGQLIKCNCIGNFGGTICQDCADSYFMNLGKCVPCNCSNNTEKNATHVCTTKGTCVNCGYNTAGDHCEKCKEGYEGDALARNCTAISAKIYDVNGHKSAVIGISVALAVVAVILAAILLYRKCWLNRKKPLQFWTVELRDDHEQVNFSSMMEQPDYQNVDASLLEKSRYYERDSPQLKNNQSQDTDVVIETTTPRTRSNPGSYRSVPGQSVQA